VTGREIKHLQSTIKKMEEKKEAEIAAAKKEMNEQLEKRSVCGVLCSSIWNAFCIGMSPPFINY